MSESLPAIAAHALALAVEPYEGSDADRCSTGASRPFLYFLVSRFYFSASSRSVQQGSSPDWLVHLVPCADQSCQYLPMTIRYCSWIYLGHVSELFGPDFLVCRMHSCKILQGYGRDCAGSVWHSHCPEQPCCSCSRLTVQRCANTV